MKKILIVACLLISVSAFGYTVYQKDRFTGGTESLTNTSLKSWTLYGIEVYSPAGRSCTSTVQIIAGQYTNTLVSGYISNAVRPLVWSDTTGVPVFPGAILSTGTGGLTNEGVRILRYEID